MSKSVHKIECRDDIWKRVVALADRRGVSPDEVVQAALIQLFSRKKGAPSDSGDSGGHNPSQEAARSKAKTPPPRRAPAPRAPREKAAPPKASKPAKRGSSLPRPGGSRLPPPGGRAQPRNRPLYLYCEGSWYTIDQDQFVIGRGSKFSDLPIKDANISRRHCAVVRRNGEYYIKDLGSTNGVEFNGERVDDHQVEEGNVYYLCDHELRFTFHPPH